MKMKIPMLAIGMLGLGAVASIGVQAFAQSTTSSAITPTATVTSTVDTPEKGDVADTNETHKHAPMGGDGIVASINGTTIVIGEEADEGGASYTVDASKVTNLPAIKVGDKIFVQGSVNGTNVSATSISLKHEGHRNEAPEAKDANGNDVETNDDATGTNQ